MRNQTTVVAVIGNPAADNGAAAKIHQYVYRELQSLGARYGIDVIDIGGGSYDESFDHVVRHRNQYDALVVIGGDGMVSLGVNALADSGVPLGIVAIGSGNDFARGLGLPINKVDLAINGIIGAVVCHTSSVVDTGTVVCNEQIRSERVFAGMLSCGLDASINDRANHSRLPNGSVRYFVAVLQELMHLRQYGYRVCVENPDGSYDDLDIISPMLTVANSRHIGGGLEVSPYSCLDDGLLDLVWIEHMPSAREVVEAISKAYRGRLLSSRLFGWRRVRSVKISRSQIGDTPPTLMADGEYVGTLPVQVNVSKRSLQVLVPPATLGQRSLGQKGLAQSRTRVRNDGRDYDTGRFLEGGQ